jgi:hypothetical protein
LIQVSIIIGIAALVVTRIPIWKTFTIELEYNI